MSGDRRAPEVRFWARIDRWDPDHCWLWMGHPAARYGSLRINGRETRAHRFAYELLVGPIPADREIDHLCGVGKCVNPKHLEAVTHRTNIRRGGGQIGRVRNGSCKNGHARADQYVDGRGFTVCRACTRLRMARFLERRR